MSVSCYYIQLSTSVNGARAVPTSVGNPLQRICDADWSIVDKRYGKRANQRIGARPESLFKKRWIGTPAPPSAVLDKKRFSQNPAACGGGYIPGPTTLSTRFMTRGRPSVDGNLLGSKECPTCGRPFAEILLVCRSH